MKRLSEQYVFYGICENFKNPAKFRYNEVFKDTNILRKAMKAKKENLMGKYYAYVDSINERMKMAITKFGTEHEYDVITNYSLNEATDVTDELKKYFKDDE
jgi:hypothetical protein